jgi:hypothetical protein
VGGLRVQSEYAEATGTGLPEYVMLLANSRQGIKPLYRKE